jgi:hypothetical protein
VRVEVSNRGKEPLTAVLEGEAGYLYRNYGFGFRGSSSERSKLDSSFDLSCPPGEERVFEFLVPVHQSMGSEERFLNLTLRDGSGGRMASALVSSEATNYRIGVSEALKQAVLRKAADMQVMENMTFQPSRSGSSGRFLPRNSFSSSSFENSIGEFKVSELPEDWRAYAGYDALLLSRVEFQALSAGLKVALAQWVRSGGHLILFNDRGVLPAGFVEGSRQDGFGHRSVIESGERSFDFSSRELVEFLSPADEAPLTPLHGNAFRGDWPLAEALGSRSLQTGLLLFALMVYAILVGPVNLFVWADRNRRHRLFITTPLISLATSLILVGFIIFRDGFGGEGARAIAIEVGGPGDKTEVVLQEQFSRSGILLSSAFSIDDQTVLNPVAPPASELNQNDSSSSQGTFDLVVSPRSDGWDISGNLFESRSEQGQFLRAVRPSREGLSLISPPGAPPELTSSFSVRLAPVFFTDGQGGVWRAESLEPGETVTLSASSGPERNDEMAMTVERFEFSHRKTLYAMFGRPNSFAALAAEAEGVESHSSIDWQESPVVVTGLAGR